MKHTIRFQWAGSTDPDDKSGTARYTVSAECIHEMRLPSYQDGHIMYLALCDAYLAGSRAGQQRMRETVSRAMREAVE